METGSILEGVLLVERLMSIIDSISDGVIAVDREMQITFFNKATERITGSTKENAIGRYCWEVFRTDICERDCALRQTFKTGKPVINRYICTTHADGRRVPISVSTALLRDHQGSVVGGVETFRDLSQVKTLRKELEGSYSFDDMIGLDRLMKIPGVVAVGQFDSEGKIIRKLGDIPDKVREQIARMNAEQTKNLSATTQILDQLTNLE